MKLNKSTLAILAAAAMCAAVPAVNAAEVYNKDGSELNLNGRFNGMQYFSGDDAEQGNKSFFRLGVDGKTKINDHMTAYGKWEYEVKLNKIESDSTQGDKTRYAFIGMDFGDFGAIDYGRNDGVIKMVAAHAGKSYEFDNKTMNFTDSFLTDRANGVFTYTTSNLWGMVPDFKLAFQYQSAENDKTGDRPLNESHGQGVGVLFDYGNIGDTGIGFAGAYTTSELSDIQKKHGTTLLTEDKDRAESWNSSLRYENGGFYTAVMYGESRNTVLHNGIAWANGNRLNDLTFAGLADKTKNIEAVVQYQFTPEIAANIGYQHSKADVTKVLGGQVSEDLVKFWDVGVKYNFTKNFYTYADYKVNLLKDNNKFGLANDDIVAVSLNYEF